MTPRDQQYLRRREVENGLVRIKYGEHGTPDQKLPNCPVCGEDELGAARWSGARVRVSCYLCRFFFDFEARAGEGCE